MVYRCLILYNDYSVMCNITVQVLDGTRKDYQRGLCELERISLPVKFGTSC